MYHDVSALGLITAGFIMFIINDVIYHCHLSLSFIIVSNIHGTPMDAYGRPWTPMDACGSRCQRCEELLPLYTADVLCASAFGKDLGMLETRKTELVQDVKKLSWAQQLCSLQGCPEPIQCFVNTYQFLIFDIKATIAINGFGR